MTEPPDISPNHPNFPQLIEERLKQYEEEYSIETFPAEHRHHLGASSIGEECWRKLWYQFRWVKLHQAEGRMRRLWNRGHREEEVFERFLMWAGFSSRSINPETDEQYYFSKVDGHFGGSIDGILLIRWAENFRIIAEYKTFANKYFIELKEKKVKLAQPKYFAQMCSYGAAFKVEYALFYAVNKDTDEWHREFVKLDWQYADQLERKAEHIIYSSTPPDRISNQASYWKCKMCIFNGICHFNEPVEKNCRSCVFASPGEKAEWNCEKYGQIPRDFLKVGCGEWKGIV